jgi:uncharacterized protein YdaU (DUF1376 family)
MAKPWFKFFVDDFIGATWRWSTLEVGAYIRLLMEQYQNGYIPSDHVELAELLNLSGREFKTVWKTVGKKFNPAGEGLVNDRMAKIRVEQQKSYERRVKAARKSHKKQAQNACNATAMQPAMQPAMHVQGASGSGSSSSSLEAHRGEYEGGSWKDCLDSVPERYGMPSMMEAIQDWSNQRTDGMGKKAPHSAISLKNQLYNLAGWGLTPAQELEVVRQAASAGWKSLRKPEADGTTKATQSKLFAQRQYDETKEAMAEARRRFEEKTNTNTVSGHILGKRRESHGPKRI